MRKIFNLFKKKDDDIETSVGLSKIRLKKFWRIFWVGLIILIITVIWLHHEQAPVYHKPDPLVKVTTDVTPEQSWMGTTQIQVDNIQAKQAEYQRQTDKHFTNIDRNLKDISSAIAVLNKKIDQKTTTQTTTTVTHEKSENNNDASITNPSGNQANLTSNSQHKSSHDNKKVLDEGNAPPSYASPQPQGMIIFNASRKVISKPELEMKKNPNAGAINIDSWAKASLLNGGDFPAGVSAQGEPRPVFLRILTNFTMPNGYRYNLKGCTALGAGYGDYSTSRVYIKVQQVSCTGHGGRDMISTGLIGQIMDSDAKIGLRGQLVENEGYKAFLATVAGIFSGLASTAAQSQSTSYMGAQGAYSVLSGQSAYNAAGGNAAASGLGELSKYFINKLNSMQPYININTGRIVTVMISETTPIHWENRQDLKIPVTTEVDKPKVTNVPASTTQNKTIGGQVQKMIMPPQDDQAQQRQKKAVADNLRRTQQVMANMNSYQTDQSAKPSNANDVVNDQTNQTKNFFDNGGF